MIDKKKRLLLKRNRDFWKRRIKGLAPNSFFRMSGRIPGHRAEYIQFCCSVEPNEVQLLFNKKRDPSLVVESYLLVSLNAALSRFLGNGNGLLCSLVAQDSKKNVGVDSRYTPVPVVLEGFGASENPSFECVKAQEKEISISSVRLDGVHCEDIKLLLADNGCSEGQLKVCLSTVEVTLSDLCGEGRDSPLLVVHCERLYTDRKIIFEYHSGLRENALIPIVANLFVRILRDLLRRPHALISELSGVDEGECLAIKKMGGNESDRGSEGNLLDLINDRIWVSQISPALSYLDRMLSYRELDDISGKVAMRLKNEFHVNRGDIVAICLERSEWMVVNIIATLKVGAAYLPIDPELPDNRISYMLRQSRCPIVLSDGPTSMRLSRLGGAFEVCVGESLDLSCQPYSSNDLRPEDLAVVFYTSGSTGSPKGVMLPHGGLYNKISSVTKFLGTNDSTRAFLTAHFSSDASFYQIFVTLFSGGCLYILDKNEQNDPGVFWHQFSKHKINFLNCVPAFLSAMLDYCGEEDRRSLDLLLLGGDAFTLDLLERIKANIQAKRILNLYGPTEICIEGTMWEHGEDSALDLVPIGRPSPTYRVKIVNEDGEMLPIGVAGEIHIGGIGVGPGYLYEEKLTEKAFYYDSEWKCRFYRTGDVGRFLPCGNIEFLGRNDHQIKVRGHRIEFAEIENELRNFGEVQDAVVFAWKNSENDNSIVACLQVIDEVPEIEFREYLQVKLPSYMLPSYFMMLSNFPLTPNKKVDRVAIRKQFFERSKLEGRASDDSRFRNSTCEKLKKIWQRLFDRNDIRIYDDFFALGGHSLKATELLSCIYKSFKIDLRLREIFENPTIEKMANVVDARKPKERSSISSSGLKFGDPFPLSYNQYGVWLEQEMSGASSRLFNMPVAIEIRGSLNVEGWKSAFERVSLKHDVLRTVVALSEAGPCSIGKFDYIPLEYEDLSHGLQSAKQVSALVDAYCDSHLDMQEGPLLHGKLVKIEDGFFVFLFLMHHIVSDGWSTKVFVNDLIGAYAEGSNTLNDDEVLPFQYGDFAVWQRNKYDSDGFKSDIDFWKSELEELPATLSLLPDFPRGEVKSFRAKWIDVHFSYTDAVRIRDLSILCNTSLFGTIFAIINLLLYRETHQSDIVIGTTVAGRDGPQFQEQIGQYVNVIPIRNRVSPEQTIKSFIESVRNRIINGFEHQSLPFDRIVKALEIEGTPSRSPIFEICVNDLTGLSLFPDEGSIPLRDLSFKPREIPNQVVPVDVVFLIKEVDGEINVRIEYNIDLYAESRIQNLAVSFTNLVKTIVEEPSRIIGELTPTTLTRDSDGSSDWEDFEL